MKYDKETMNRRPLQRPGLDQDPVVPWAWGTWGLVEPVEILSFPIPAAQDGIIDEQSTIMIRTTPGDPTTLREVMLKDVACFDRSRHHDNLKYKEQGT